MESQDFLEVESQLTVRHCIDVFLAGNEHLEECEQKGKVRVHGTGLDHLVYHLSEHPSVIVVVNFLKEFLPVPIFLSFVIEELDGFGKL